MQLQQFNEPRSRKTGVWVTIGVIAVVAGGVIFWRAGRRADSSGSAAALSPAAAVAAEPPAAANAPAVQAAPAPAPVALAAGASATGLPVSATTATAAVAQVLREADELGAGERYVEARDRCWGALESCSDPDQRRECETRIGRYNIELMFTPRPAPEKVDCIIKRGDLLAKIAQQNGTTVDLIQKGNMIAAPERIKVGDRLKVLAGKFALVVNKTHNDLVVTLNGRFFKRYGVGTGKFGKTPVGTFVVNDRIREPVWWRPDGRAIPYGDKENILGTRWMSLKATGQTPDVKGYGLHGTWDPSSIGKAESAGCIRLRNEDVEELFTLIPLGTPVTIEE